MSDGPAPAGACGRADLLRALVQGGAPLLAPTAALLGYVEQPERILASISALSVAVLVKPPVISTLPPPQVADCPLANARFWRLETYEPLPSEEPEPEPPAAAPLVWTNRPDTPPVMYPLAAWPDLRRRLNPRLAAPRDGPEPDLERLVARLGRGLLLERLPRRQQRCLGPTLQLVFDRSEHLVPYWCDQDRVAAELARLLPVGALTRGVFHEGLTAPRLLDRPDGRYRPPPAGGLVLVLGDLGSLALDAPPEPWLMLGRHLVAAGCRAVALVPCRPGRVHKALQRLWNLVEWERPAGVGALAGLGRGTVGNNAQSARGAGTRRLLALLAPAVRIEPGLLRAVRRSLADPALDAAAESEVWQDGALASTHSEAATLNPRALPELRAAFAAEEPEVQEAVLRLLRTWRSHLPPEIWFEEVLNLAPRTQDALVQPRDLADARRFFAALCTDLGQDLNRDPAAPGPAGDWMRRVMARATGIWKDAQVGLPLVRLDWAMHRHRTDYRPPIPVAPAELPAGDRAVRRLAVSQQGADLVFAPLDQPPPIGSPLAVLETRNRLISIGPPDADRDSLWETGEPPSWATDWGWDRYGAWVLFAVRTGDGGAATQRMRWIAPGSFRMGSPPDEPGRWKDEGPQHPVTLSEGYWLFDTPCTQALWAAAMGENPSRFQSPERPVEQVSWKQAQDFIERLNGLLPGLELSLPREAQWEYACRAGTDTALYTGPIAILGERNAPALDPIAWYGGNSGVDFKLANGYDSSDWPERQYPNPRSGTHPVGTKQANPWGLYDMLGNVWEWVQDPWHDDYKGAPQDGSVWASSSPGAARVVRGGSWYGNARRCRCASRLQDAPDYRDARLGFRCARVQGREPGQTGGPDGAERGPGSGAAERARLARPGPRSGSGRARPGGRRVAEDGLSLQLLRLESGAPATVPLPTAPRIQLLTDRERLTLCQIEKPAWASAIGRDRFGLWAEIAVTPRAAEAALQRRRWWSLKAAPKPSPQPDPEPVIQRLRWIPPGRFQMGSPAGEPGRWNAEGPQHPVTIGQGYWLFDTPCTQALWIAVMAENPSRFKDPRRPVEQLSWDNAQGFIERINESVHGLALTLPTEAQWEYACRAGTETALYTGPIDILGERNAPALDPIAWYGGNSGVDYDLDEAHKTVGDLWKEMQYETKRAGTRRVKGKQPNPWGLYDMLGNVWEWVADPWHDNYRDAPIDGTQWDNPPGAARVVRGGSWGGLARDCRCASRYRVAPDYRDDFLGFRCARVQES